MTVLTRENFNDPTHNPVTPWTPTMWSEMPHQQYRGGLAAWLTRLEELLGHGVDADWHEHPNPEDGTEGVVEVRVHALYFAHPDEGPWLLTLKGEVHTDPDLAPDWTWAWDSADSDEMLWETAPELNGWGWPTSADAVDVLTLLTREREQWDDGLSDLHGPGREG
ncbi:hypothetical protein ACIRPH_31600 [Nocardiopsis sp. NPDC101807]|uniref:hypothetical protein n=1 Tax=Nocardiopsis sp. NPDC101807 TaxID=3364339 RepID=UPI003808DD54